MYDSVILLTKSFPFDNGEEFLENEIFALSEAFRNVLIISTSVRNNRQKTRELPANVQFIGIKGIGKPSFRYLWFSLKGLKYICSQETARELHASDSFFSKLACVYYAGRCHYLLKKAYTDNTVRSFIEKSNGLLIYSYWFSDLPYLAVLLSRQYPTKRIKMVSRAHGYDLYEERNRGGRIPFRETVFGSIDTVYPCSVNGERYLKNRYPAYKEKIKHSYLGTMDHGKREDHKGSIFHLITCSSIIPLKRLDIVVDALRELESKSVPVRWTCIGDGPLLERIRKDVEEKLRTTQVSFTGRLTNKDVLELYRTAGFDLFVNVSETEGLPVSIMEAVSFGIPAVATNVGGTNEIVIDGKTGFLLNKSVSPEELAEGIDKAMHYPWDREGIRAFWRSTFHAETNYRRFTDDLLK